MLTWLKYQKLSSSTLHCQKNCLNRGKKTYNHIIRTFFLFPRKGVETRDCETYNTRIPQANILTPEKQGKRTKENAYIYPSFFFIKRP